MAKYIRAIVSIVMISVCLFGCGKQDVDKPAVEPTNQVVATLSFAIETTDGKQAVETATSAQHIAQEVCENLSIDTDAVIPAKDQYSTYTLKMVDCDPDRLFGIFSPGGYESYTMEDLRKDHGHIIYHESSGKELSVYENLISYSTFNFNMEEKPMQDVKTLMYYHTLERPNAVPHDLAFMSVAQMEEFGRDILAQLGIAWEPKLLRCVTLSGEEILNFQKELFSDGIYAEFTPTTLTEATDTCYLQFNFDYDGIPLIGADEPTVSSYESWESSPAVTATILLNADGIQTCEVFFPCTIETASDPLPILNLEDAIATLKGKYDLEIIFEPRTITGFYMEYIPVKQGKTMVLTPYWCFKETNETLVGKPGYLGNADRFNAITGKDLAYGG